MAWLLAVCTADLAGFSEWNGAVGPAVGGFISVASTVGVKLVDCTQKAGEDRIRLAATLAGELRGIVTFLESNQVEQSLRGASIIASGGTLPNVQKIPALRDGNRNCLELA